MTLTKNILTVVFAAILSVANLNASSIDIVKGKVIKIELANEGTVEVILMDSEGETLYNEIYEGKKFVKEFDFSALPNGKYYLAIESQVKKESHYLSIEETKVVEENIEVFYKPSVRIKNDLIIVSKFKLDNHEVKVTILDNNGQFVYTQKVKDNEEGLSLNLSALPKGAYEIIASNQAFRVKKSIDIE